MYLQRPDETSGGSRFLLALSLSTVTAFAVAAPLAFKAISVDSDPAGQDAVVRDVGETTTTTTIVPSGPQIGPKVRSPQAKLPIRPGLPSDYPLQSTSEPEASPAPAPSPTATTVITTAPTTSTTETVTTTASTDTTVDSTSSTTATTATTSTTSTSSSSSSTSIELETSAG